jgi:hypothetical protein
MTGTNEWHADDRLLAGYVGGVLDLATAMSLEQHVMRCPRCRDELGRRVDPAPLDGVWQRVEHRVEGSLRQRWRRTRFRLRSVGGLIERPELPRVRRTRRPAWLQICADNLPGSSWGPGSSRALVWFGGATLTALTVLSISWLLVSAGTGSARSVADPAASSPSAVAAAVARPPSARLAYLACQDPGPGRRCGRSPIGDPDGTSGASIQAQRPTTGQCSGSDRGVSQPARLPVRGPVCGGRALW